MGDVRRLYFLDNLRIALTILVIAHHVGQAYGPTGGSWPIQEAARAAILGPFFTVNRSFFMSLFHVPVIVAIQAGVLDLAMPPFAKFILVTAVGVPLTFLLSAAVRTPAFMRRVL